MSRSASARAVSTRAAAISVVRLPLGEADVRPTFRRERAALKRGVWPIAGCDEAGRGPLAGPVVAAAVVLDPKRVPRGLDDSKKLDPQTREKLHAKICASAQVAVAFAPPWRIDRDNILRASLWALARAVAGLPVKPQLVFVDGRDRIDIGFDCRRLRRRQGHARPAHDAIGHALSRLWLRASQGLQRARTFRGAGAARPHHPPPPLFRPGRRGLWRRRNRRHGDRRDRAGRVASLASRLYLCRSRRVTSR